MDMDAQDQEVEDPDVAQIEVKDQELQQLLCEQDLLLTELIDVVMQYLGSFTEDRIEEMIMDALSKGIPDPRSSSQVWIWCGVTRPYLVIDCFPDTSVEPVRISQEKLFVQVDFESCSKIFFDYDGSYEPVSKATVSSFNVVDERAKQWLISEMYPTFSETSLNRFWG